MLPTSPTRAQSVPAPLIVPLRTAPPVAASLASTMLHESANQLPSAKLTTSVLSLPMVFSVALTVPLADTENEWVTAPLAPTIPSNLSVTVGLGVGAVG